MEPFKNNINAASVDLIAEQIPGEWDRDGFRRLALAELDTLELKERVIQLADALHTSLPSDYPTALAQLLSGLKPPAPDANLTDLWSHWPLCSFVERHGLNHRELSLNAMEQLTQYWSCEFAIRPYFAAEPDAVLTRLRRWVKHPNVHVRRLVSEGSRPRLPWGIRLQHRIAHPEAMLPLLEALRDDPEEYVRRSVANHLNDITKDHPELVLRTLEGWLTDAPPTRLKLIKHALRTLIKAGDPRAYALIGLQPFTGAVQVERSPERISMGEGIKLAVTLRSQSDTPQRLRLDLGLHFRLKNDSLSTKVFHWTERTLKPGEVMTLEKVYTVKKVTTRRLYPGEQAIDLRVNGTATPTHTFVLDVPNG